MKHYLLGIILFYSLLFILMPGHSTGAYFSDSSTSTANSFMTATVFPTPIASQSAHIVISEVQIDGGNGAANDNDFIELYNPTNSPFSLNGHRLVKRTGNSPNDTNIFTFSSGHIVPAHGFFLWAHNSTANPFAPTIFADASSSADLAASNSIALRNGDLNTGTIIDALSWDPGAASLKEGAQFGSNPEANQSAERKALSTSDITSMMSGADVLKGNGFDSDNNATDFILRTTSQPQNSSSPTETP